MLSPIGVTTGAEPVTFTILELPILVKAGSSEPAFGQTTPILVKRYVQVDWVIAVPIQVSWLAIPVIRISFLPLAQSHLILPVHLGVPSMPAALRPRHLL